MRGYGTEIDDSKSQLSCVIGLSRNKNGEKSHPSLPIRNGRAKWSSSKSTSGHSNDISLETHFGKEQTNKTFEVSVMLSRGNEQVLIGVASLTFLSALLETEVEIPIYPIGSDDAIEISHRAKTRKKRNFLGGDHVQDSYFQSNPFIKVDGVHAVSFLGGDCDRKYYSERHASIRLRVSRVFNYLLDDLRLMTNSRLYCFTLLRNKCACLPTRYEQLLLQFQTIMRKQSLGSDSNTPKSLGSSSTTRTSSISASSRISMSPHSHVSSKSHIPSRDSSSPSTHSTQSRNRISSRRHDSLQSPAESCEYGRMSNFAMSNFAPMSKISEDQSANIGNDRFGMVNSQFSSGSPFEDLYSQPSSSITFSYQPDTSTADSMDLKALYHHLGRKMNNMADADMRSLRRQIASVMDSHLGRSFQKVMMELKSGFLSMNKLGIGGFEQLEADSRDENMRSLAMTSTSSSSFPLNQNPADMRYMNSRQNVFNHEISHHSLCNKYRDLNATRRRVVLGEMDYVADTPTVSIPSRETSLACTSISTHSSQFPGHMHDRMHPIHSPSSQIDENGYSSWSGEYTPVFDKYYQE